MSTAVFRLYNRLLQRHSNFLFRPVVKTPPVEVKPAAKAVLYTVLDRRNCRAYLLALKSFLRYCADVRVVVQNDGTITERQERELRQHIRGMEIYDPEASRRLIRERAAAELNELLPDLQGCHFFLTLKLLNVFYRFRGNDVILLDSDILFLKRPTFVLDW